MAKPVEPEEDAPHEGALEDARWIATILSGKSVATANDGYAKLLKKYWKLVMVLAYGRIGDRREAEDIAQEAFIRAFRSLDNLSHPVAFLGWLLQISRNLITDHLRSRRSHVSLDALGGEEPALPPGRGPPVPQFETDLETAEEMERVLDAMNDLPERYREVVALRYLQGLSGKEMADVLGEPEGTVRNRLFRAVEKLRERLGIGRLSRT